ncbi:heavy metal response regulator transcription factor [Acinetobacter seifertii]|uniref:Heavy metal response regulator transcription factor n=1 Tax=Acinetobacter seifertii TaxID=1530123 RepID=A0A7H2VAX2_9GAMM|nr:heavy metal response regulator transcription factor [Acinetobacter seifertii]MBZ6534068.1 heavy metal response regulator transcription factor [Acinetobacter seifertii]QNX73505.1 heavy metal response regulator transcription factor [Acinetobacter seifertii]
MKILLVEDEHKTGQYLKDGLTESGYNIDLACDGLSGLHFYQTESYDLIILDVMLPKLNGWHLIDEIRQKNDSIPIIFLTAKDSIEDRVKGLNLGADDYLIKPFAFAELLARIKSLLKRGKKQEIVTELNVLDLHLDIYKRRASRSGKKIDLTAKEFMLLELLMRRQGEVLPKSLIASLLWDMNFESDTNVIEVAINRLRNKVDNNFKQKLIHNIRGMGYILDIKSE